MALKDKIPTAEVFAYKMKEIECQKKTRDIVEIENRVCEAFNQCTTSTYIKIPLPGELWGGEALQCVVDELRKLGYTVCFGENFGLPPDEKDSEFVVCFHIHITR